MVGLGRGASWRRGGALFELGGGRARSPLFIAIVGHLNDFSVPGVEGHFFELGGGRARRPFFIAILIHLDDFPVRGTEGHLLSSESQSDVEVEARF